MERPVCPATEDCPDSAVFVPAGDGYTATWTCACGALDVELHLSEHDVIDLLNLGEREHQEGDALALAARHAAGASRTNLPQAMLRLREASARWDDRT